MKRTILPFLLLIMMQANSQSKNFIVILTDDQGYEDLGCFGSKRMNTPNIDKLAKEGMKLTSFYTSSSVCSPSRASLLTGRMPKRVGVPAVLFPNSKTGLPETEITIAELLKSKGYKTAVIGKWHLGHLKQFLPTNQGFDYYFGLPYSNDMSIAKELQISKNIKLNNGYTLNKLKTDQQQTELNRKDKSIKNIMPLMRNEEVVEYPVDQSQLTKRYTQEAVSFIKRNKKNPFFLYLPHTMPHHPLYVSKDFDGSSGNGVYTDAIQEVDWSVGQIVKTLKESGLDKETFILFCSDNGPANRYNNPEWASAGPLRGVKFDTFEGGQRVPAIVWAPGTIKPNTESDEITSTLDILPTIAHYTGIALPQNRIYDGYNLTDLFRGETIISPRKEVYFYTANRKTIEGIRVGDWKYLEKGSRFTTLNNKGEKPTKLVGDIKPMLFNLNKDVIERANVFDKYPEKVTELKRKMKEFDASIK
ncbi:sulfatase family protein [Lutibacter citreus]|uniref:sulfatase family protein n=1 Tax=Lutibacter citreus TaxID=2138210 RepID=UPI001C55439E|nr:sulfatase [Lutibacter citreus]